jgi:hypothetical protein
VGAGPSTRSSKLNCSSANTRPALDHLDPLTPPTQQQQQDRLRRRRKRKKRVLVGFMLLGHKTLASV